MGLITLPQPADSGAVRGMMYALRGRYGGTVRAKGILETGGGYVRFDLADGLYSITGADGVSTEPQCVFIGRQLRPAEIAARLADPDAFI